MNSLWLFRVSEVAAWPTGTTIHVSWPLSFSHRKSQSRDGMFFILDQAEICQHHMHWRGSLLMDFMAHDSGRASRMVRSAVAVDVREQVEYKEGGADKEEERKHRQEGQGKGWRVFGWEVQEHDDDDRASLGVQNPVPFWVISGGSCQEKGSGGLG